jgi:nicotinamidase-related amidase
MVKGLQFGFPNSDLVVRGVDLDQDSNAAFYVSTPGSPSHLRDLLGDIKTLYLCGASPDGCIEQTAQTASSLGYQPTILSDCSVLPLSVPILEG